MDNRNGFATLNGEQVKLPRGTVLDQNGVPWSKRIIEDVDPHDQDGRLLDADKRVIPHVYTFTGLYNTYAKTFSYRWDEALKHLPENALAMRRDTFIQAMLQERYLPTAVRPWEIVPEDPDDEDAKEEAKVVQRACARTPDLTMALLSLSEAAWYGRYGLQVDHEKDDGLWSIKSWDPLNGDKIQYRWGGKTPAVFIYSPVALEYPKEYIVYTDRVPALVLGKEKWRRQFIIHRFKRDDADYFEPEMAGRIAGVGLRDQIYWSWWLRDELLSWAVDFMKKVGTLGLMVFWYEMGNKTAKAEAQLNAQRASHDTVLVMGRPSGNEQQTWGVDHFPAQHYGIEALQRMIADYFESHMERLIIGQTLSSDSEGSGLGGTGVADLHKETKHNLLKYDAINMGETLTRDLVKVLHKLNFPKSKKRLKWQFNIEDPFALQKLEAINKGYSMGVDYRTDSVRALSGEKKPEKGEDRIGMNVAAEDAAAQQQAGGQDQMGGGDQGPAGGWRPTRSGRGFWNPTTRQWKPAGASLLGQPQGNPNVVPGQPVMHEMTGWAEFYGLTYGKSGTGGQLGKVKISAPARPEAAPEPKQQNLPLHPEPSRKASEAFASPAAPKFNFPAPTETAKGAYSNNPWLSDLSEEAPKQGKPHLPQLDPSHSEHLHSDQGIHYPHMVDWKASRHGGSYSPSSNEYLPMPGHPENATVPQGVDSHREAALMHHELMKHHGNAAIQHFDSLPQEHQEKIAKFLAKHAPHAHRLLVGDHHDGPDGHAAHLINEELSKPEVQREMADITGGELHQAAGELGKVKAGSAKHEQDILGPIKEGFAKAAAHREAAAFHKYHAIGTGYIAAMGGQNTTGLSSQPKNAGQPAAGPATAPPPPAPGQTGPAQPSQQAAGGIAPPAGGTPFDELIAKETDPATKKILTAMRASHLASAAKVERATVSPTDPNLAVNRPASDFAVPTAATSSTPMPQGGQTTLRDLQNQPKSADTGKGGDVAIDNPLPAPSPSPQPPASQSPAKGGSVINPHAGAADEVIGQEREMAKQHRDYHNQKVSEHNEILRWLEDFAAHQYKKDPTSAHPAKVRSGEADFDQIKGLDTATHFAEKWPHIFPAYGSEAHDPDAKTIPEILEGYYGKGKQKLMSMEEAMKQVAGEPTQRELPEHDEETKAKISSHKRNLAKAMKSGNARSVAYFQNELDKLEGRKKDDEVIPFFDWRSEFEMSVV